MKYLLDRRKDYGAGRDFKSGGGKKIVLVQDEQPMNMYDVWMGEMFLVIFT